MAARRSVDHFLPLTTPMLHTLLALADGDKHGYAIIREIAQRTDGTVRLGAGTLYALVKRALGDGLLVESDERPDASLDDERRRYYRLTALGRAVAEAEVARLHGIVDMARAEETSDAKGDVMKIFRALLRLLPIDFRIEHGREMEQIFRAQRSDARAGGIRALAHLWLETLQDLVLTAPTQHLAMLRQDVSYALHTLRRTPAFTLAAVLTLAIGISASASIFTIINAFFFRPLPVDRPHELVSITTAADHHIEMPHGVSYPDLQDYAAMADVFSGMVGYQAQRVWMNAQGRVDRIVVEALTEDAFGVLGVGPAFGRMFTASDARAPVVVLAHGYWQARFNADPSIIGTAVRMNEEVFTVVGVADMRFKGLESLIHVSGYVPMTSLMQLRYHNAPGATFLDTRDMHQVFGIGRLRPEVSVAQARAALAVKASALASQYPDTNRNVSLYVVPETQARPVPQNGPMFHVAAIVLAVLASLLLLITSANLANMLLARASSRGREIALRAALGARNGRIVRQLLTESVVLAVLGCVPGVLLAMGASSLIARGLTATSIDAPLRFDFDIDWRVMSLTLVVAIIAGVLSGLAPALHARRADVVSLLKAGGRGQHGAERGRLRRLLIVGQVAVSLVLLIVGGLFVKTLSQARTVDLGFRPEQMLMLRVDLEHNGYPADRRWPYFEAVRDRVAALPGVRDAAWISGPPFSYDQSVVTLRAEGRPNVPKELRTTFTAAVDPRYFAAAGVPIVAGRAFETRDRREAPRVVIVNETLAETLWPNQSPLGRRVQLIDSKEDAEVVGVAKNGKYILLWEAPRGMLFEPLAQRPPARATLEVIAAGSPDDLAQSVRVAVQRIDPDVPVYGVTTMRDYLEYGDAFIAFRIGAICTGIFGVLGLILVSIGLYGVVAYDAGLRTHEIGVRMALGARRGVMLRQIVASGAGLAILGVVIGTGLAAMLAWNLRNMLLGVDPFDLVTYGRTAALLIGVCLIASLLPARRAATADPLVALRTD